jgi:hypothetical protein
MLTLVRSGRILFRISLLFIALYIITEVGILQYLCPYSIEVSINPKSESLAAVVTCGRILVKVCVLLGAVYIKIEIVIFCNSSSMSWSLPIFDTYGQIWFRYAYY